MNRVILIAAIFIFGVAQAEIYKYINKQGKTAYSDVPIAGAEKVIMPPVMTYVAPVIPEKIEEATQEEISPSADNGELEVIYETLQIISPQDDTSPQLNEGTIAVQYFVYPSLQKQHRLVLYRNGEPQEDLILTNLTRGELTLRLAVLDSQGEEKFPAPK